MRDLLATTHPRLRRLLLGAGLVTLLAACTLPVRFASPPGGNQATSTPSPASGTPVPGASTAPGTIPSPAAPNASGALAQFQAELRKVIDNVTPSVVQIETPSGLGSGVVMDTAGNIVTNAHVVGSDTAFTVTTSDGHTYQASLVGTYANNDLAVIKVNAGDNGLKPATFGDSSQARVGDIVLAIGSPLGLNESVSEGIISATGRSQSESRTVQLNDLIQTTAALNPGNSGGALVDISGHVIGIPTLAGGSGRGGQAANIGFAIPSNQVLNVTKQLGSGGTVTHTNQAYLGVTAGSATGGGALVTSVVTGGPADSAGIKPDWVITSLGGTAIADSASVTKALAGYKPGDKVDIVFRLPDGSSKTVNVTLGERPANP